MDYTKLYNYLFTYTDWGGCRWAPNDNPYAMITLFVTCHTFDKPASCVCLHTFVCRNKNDMNIKLLFCLGILVKIFGHRNDCQVGSVINSGLLQKYPGLDPGIGVWKFLWLPGQMDGFSSVCKATGMPWSVPVREIHVLISSVVLEISFKKVWWKSLSLYICFCMSISGSTKQQTSSRWGPRSSQSGKWAREYGTGK